MKRYISAILVPCFLLQLLVGCYSYKDITLEELQKYSGPNDVTITTNKDKIIINREYSDKSRMDWEVKDSSVLVQTTELVRENNSSKAIEKITK